MFCKGVCVGEGDGEGDGCGVEVAVPEASVVVDAAKEGDFVSANSLLIL